MFPQKSGFRPAFHADEIQPPNTLYANGFAIGSGASYTTAQTWNINFGPQGAAQVVFAVSAWNGGGPAGLVVSAQMTLVHAASTCTGAAVVVSDASWSWPGTATVPAGFQNTTYDSSSWVAVTKGVAYGMAPWCTLAVTPANGTVNAF